jgi:hypothetical protein
MACQLMQQNAGNIFCYNRRYITTVGKFLYGKSNSTLVTQLQCCLSQVSRLHRHPSRYLDSSAGITLLLRMMSFQCNESPRGQISAKRYRDYKEEDSERSKADMTPLRGNHSRIGGGTAHTKARDIRCWHIIHDSCCT